ncbi:MAG: hypothetical protein JST00_22355 [Deltaproteobacteria bacterium]|nr:hypothetical protein [Deltaproteobacteria bacterium]
MKLRVFLCTFSLALACVAGSSRSYAQQPVDDASRAAARSLGYDGVRAYEAGDFEAASEKLERAYGVLRVPTIGLWSARSLVKRGRLVAASERFLEVSRLVLPDLEPEVHRKAQADAVQERAALMPRLAHLVVVVTSAPEEATLTVDGQLVPLAIWGSDLPVDPGARHIEIASGARKETRDVQLAEGQTERVEIALARVTVAPVHTGDWPAEAEKETSPAPPSSLGPTLRTAGWISIGVGSAAVVMGSIMGGVAVGQGSTLDSVSCKADVCARSASDDVDAYHRSRTLSIVGLWVGGAVLATGITLVLVAPSPARGRTTSVSLAPLGISGVGFVGRY